MYDPNPGKYLILDNIYVLYTKVYIYIYASMLSMLSMSSMSPMLSKLKVKPAPNSESGDNYI